jgi:hypothetical protein
MGLQITIPDSAVNSNPGNLSRDGTRPIRSTRPNLDLPRLPHRRWVIDKILLA